MPTPEQQIVFSPNAYRHPCRKDCQNRYPGCGATCEAWQKYLKDRNDGYQAHIEHRDARAASISFVQRHNKAVYKKKQ